MISIKADKIKPPGDCRLIRLFNNFDDNISEKAIIKESRITLRYLHCLINPDIAKVLYALALSRISTPSILRRNLRLSSRDIIENYSLRAINAGFIEIKSINDIDYDIYWDFWKNKVKHSRKGARLYVATDELLNVVLCLKGYLEKLLHPGLIKKFSAQGDYFDDYYTKRISLENDQEYQRERIALETVASCYKCDKALTDRHIKMKLTREINGNLYCKECHDQIMNDGSINKIYREKNNGHA